MENIAIGLQEAIDELEAQLTETLNVEKAAKRACLSPFYFQRMFGALCGMTVGEYVRSRRLTLAGQELSSGQLYERLGRRFTQPTAAAVVAEMVERQYVDDERYARTRAHGLLAARKSRRAAAQDLRQKGLDAQQISAALEEAYAPDEAGGDPELEAAAALVEGRYRGKLAAGRKDLVVAALARRGFAYPVIKEAIRRVEEDG